MKQTKLENTHPQNRYKQMLHQLQATQHVVGLVLFCARQRELGPLQTRGVQIAIIVLDFCSR